MRGNFQIIDDSYNANPDSMREALGLFKKMRATRRIAVLGDMLELGEDAPFLHREVGELLANLGIDAVFTLGNLARETAEKAKEKGVGDVFFFSDKDKLVRELDLYLRPGDSVLVKGSRNMPMDEIVQELRRRPC